MPGKNQNTSWAYTKRQNARDNELLFRPNGQEVQEEPFSWNGWGSDGEDPVINEHLTPLPLTEGDILEQERMKENPAPWSAYAGQNGSNGQNGEVATETQPAQDVSEVVKTKFVPAKPKSGTSYLDNLVGRESWALSPEEEQRRLRRMHTAAMIGNLGNVMGAFANMYYAGKGAPSQKVPDAVIPPYMQFSNMVQQARRNAATQKLALEKLKSDKEDKMLALRMKQLELDMKRPVYEAQARSYDALVLQRQAAAAYNEARIAIQQGNYELAKRKIEEAERHNRAVEAIQGRNASTNAARLDWQTQPEYTETTVDESEYGKKTTSVKKGRGSSNSGTQNGKTPPSKQPQRKAPPSRQK